MFAVSGVLMLGYAGWLARQHLPPPRPDGSTPWSSLVAVMRDSRVLRLAAMWTFIAALDEPFLGFLIATFQDTRGFSAAAATLLAGSIVLGGIAAFTVLAATTRQREPRRRPVVAAVGLLLTAVVMVGAPWTPVIALAGFGFGAATAVTWVTIQVTVLRLRPGQVGTTQAVVSGLSTAGIVIPPLVGVAADRLGLTAGMWLYASVPAAIVLLVLTDKGRDRSRA